MNKPRLSIRVLVAGMLVFLCLSCWLSSAAAGSPPAAGAKLSFKRVFQGSSPELALRAKIFALADELHNFQGQDLDVHRKIANLGEKTFRWQQGSISHETRFNYTLNSSATHLLQIFEGLARQQEHFALLSRRIRYDRLGINDALLQFESDLNRGLMPEPQRLVPLLEQIASDTKFVEIARQRARILADRLRRQS